MSEEGFFEKLGRDLREKTREVRDNLFQQHVTVFPTYGYRDPREPGTWVVPMRLWVHDNRDMPFVEQAIERWAAKHFERDLGRPLEPHERARLATTLSPFIADDKSGEQVEITFADDPHGRVFSLAQRTSANGVIEDALRLPAELVADLVAGDPRKWCQIHARTTDGHGSGEGRIRFLESDGWSIVSDIDDTVKITRVPAGKRTVLRSVFLEKFRAADGMRVRYEQLAATAGEDVCFHYVSGSPWQLYGLLSEFLIDAEGFPPGTFHMKSLRKNLLEPGAFDSIRAFVLGGDLATLDQKIRQITFLMIHLPQRKFILIGDSGEKDPEVYRAIQRLFPDQVRRIIIRDVMGERLAGMELITGPDVPVALDSTQQEAEMLELVRLAREEAPRTDVL